jgi:hypothetical protein
MVVYKIKYLTQQAINANVINLVLQELMVLAINAQDHLS